MRGHIRRRGRNSFEIKYDLDRADGRRPDVPFNEQLGQCPHLFGGEDAHRFGLDLRRPFLGGDVPQQQAVSDAFTQGLGQELMRVVDGAGGNAALTIVPAAGLERGMPGLDVGVTELL